MGRQRWGRVVGALVWLTAGCLDCREAAASTVRDNVESMECRADGSCSSLSAEPSSCGLYMAPSSIAGAGWGIYTATDIPENSTIDMLDIIIPIVFDRSQTRLQKQLYGIDLHHSLLDDYTRELSVVVVDDPDAGNDNDDDVRVEGLSPGLGMLAKSHRGHSNMNPTACRSQGAGSRFHASAGASSNYQECGFAATRFIPAGHELFQGHGKDRIPQRTNGAADPQTKSTMVRSLDWLKQNGACVDNVRVEPLHDQISSSSGSGGGGPIPGGPLCRDGVARTAPVSVARGPAARGHQW
jgi:hypothetical protein